MKNATIPYLIRSKSFFCRKKTAPFILISLLDDLGQSVDLSNNQPISVNFREEKQFVFETTISLFEVDIGPAG